MPGVRATNDIDLFLRAEVLADHARTTEVAGTLATLGYSAVPEAKFFQWARPVQVGGYDQEVKIDILVGPISSNRADLKVRRPRVRPKGDIQFHAFHTEEALHIEDQPIMVPVRGLASDGTRYEGTVLVPEAFPYLMMKLHAFADRKDEGDKDFGRHHALDLYAVVGMMTENEYERARAFGEADREDVHVRRAREIVATDFGRETATGVLRLKEHPLSRPDFRIADFLSVLVEVFPSG